MFCDLIDEIAFPVQMMKQSMEDVELAMTNVAEVSQQSSDNVKSIRNHRSKTLHAIEDVIASSEHQAGGI